MTEPRPTAWYSWAEFLTVYEGISSADADENQRAVDIVSVWRTRGVKLPVAVESTAALIEASLCDSARPDCHTRLSVHALQSLYAMGIMRFCNGLVDTLQKGMHAKAVEALAEEVGVPSWIPDLRHQIAHKDLPSLPILRLAAKEALNWLSERYWKEQIALLESAEQESESPELGEECDEAVLAMYEACKEEAPSKYRHTEKSAGGLGMARKVVAACRDEERLLRFFLHHVFAQQTPTQSLIKATGAVAACASDDLAPTLSARLLDAAFSSLPVSSDSDDAEFASWDEVALTSQRAQAWIEAFVSKGSNNRVGRALIKLRGNATVKAVATECRTGQSTSRSVLSALGLVDFATREAEPLSLEDAELLTEPLTTPRKQTPWVAIGSEWDDESGEVRKCVTDLGLADEQSEQQGMSSPPAEVDEVKCSKGCCKSKAPADAETAVAEECKMKEDAARAEELSASDSETLSETAPRPIFKKNAAFWAQVVAF